MALSLKRLVDNWTSYSYNGKPRQQVNPVASFSVSKLAPIPAFDAFAVQFRFLPYSDTSRTFYEVTYLFHDITYVEEQDAEHDLGVEIVPGTVRYINRPSYTRSPVQVSCMCQDFAFCFAVALDRRDSLAANLSYYPSAGYIRRTPPPPSGRPWANEKMVPTICKHLLRSVRTLSQKSFIQP